MVLEYMPVFKARKGEFDAIANLKEASFIRIEPIFELPTLSEFKIRETKYLRESAEPFAEYLSTVADGIASLPRQLRYYIDIRGWAPNATIESGEHILSYVYRRLHDRGATICPVASYDFWADPEYQEALRNLPVTSESFVAIRLGADALEDMDDPDFFSENFDEILSVLSVLPSQCSVVIDFGDVTSVSAIDIQSRLETAIHILARFELRAISIAASSVSASINDMVSEQNSTAMIVRREMNAWKSVKSFYPVSNLIFGDYGVRSPDSLEDGPYPHVNGKIRYTCEGHFFVLRGHSMQTYDKGAQYDNLARLLVESPYFMGRDFSWGDFQTATKPPHSPASWVGLDTNHHIEAVLMELIEFKQRIMSGHTVSS